MLLPTSCVQLTLLDSSVEVRKCHSAYVSGETDFTQREQVQWVGIGINLAI